jgi:hypothetical protein
MVCVYYRKQAGIDEEEPEVEVRQTGVHRFCNHWQTVNDVLLLAVDFEISEKQRWQNRSSGQPPSILVMLWWVLRLQQCPYDLL